MVKTVPKWKVARLLVGVLIVFVLTGCTSLADGDAHAPEQIGDIDQIAFNEPSGIVFHPGRSTLFVVGDEGDIAEIQTDGALVKQARIRHADFEGITVDPSTGLLYIAVEGEEKILEVDPRDFALRREFIIDRRFEGSTLLSPLGEGIEAITFVADPEHLQGGTFYLANQSSDPSSQEDPSIVFEVEVPLQNSATGNREAKILRFFPLGLADLSGLDYDSDRECLYVISDSENVILGITREGLALRSWVIPGEDQEGIAVDRDGFLYIAQDSGGIIKFLWGYTK
jgi:hypothetical protein